MPASIASTASRLMRPASRGRRRRRAASLITAAGSPSAITRPASMHTSRSIARTSMCTMCSIQTIATPSARIPAIVCSRTSASASVRPAPISSRSSSRGRVASARASSSRLRSSRPRLSARRLATRRRPHELEHLGAACRTPPARRGGRRRSPRRTRSRTRSGRRTACGTWCARPIPSRQRLSALARVTSAPAKRTVPAVGPKRAGEDVQKRRLAGAVGADDADGVSLAQHEVDAVDHRQGTEALADSHRLDERCGCLRHYALYGTSLAATGMLGSSEFSQKTELERPLCALDPLAARDRGGDHVRHRPLAPRERARAACPP